MGTREVVVIILSYFIGCINTGYYYTRFAYKKDIRNVGTNVTGAMNVSRIAGKKGFIITFLGDALKGAFVVFLCRMLSVSETATLFSILTVIAGHIFPIQLQLKGGKGLSTAFGALLAFNPLFILYLIITCGILLPFVRRYTVTSLFAFLLLPLELQIAGYHWRVRLLILLCVVMIFYACRSNLKEYAKAGRHKRR